MESKDKEGRREGGQLVRAVQRGIVGIEVLSFYLEIIELDCDWLEDVVAALS